MTHLGNHNIFNVEKAGNGNFRDLMEIKKQIISRTDFSAITSLKKS